MDGCLFVQGQVAYMNKPVAQAYNLHLVMIAKLALAYYFNKVESIVSSIKLWGEKNT